MKHQTKQLKQFLLNTWQHWCRFDALKSVITGEDSASLDLPNVAMALHLSTATNL